jgi:hypothetical protein
VRSWRRLGKDADSARSSFDDKRARAIEWWRSKVAEALLHEVLASSDPRRRDRATRFVLQLHYLACRRGLNSSPLGCDSDDDPPRVVIVQWGDDNAPPARLARRLVRSAAVVKNQSACLRL